MLFLFTVNCHYHDRNNIQLLLMFKPHLKEIIIDKEHKKTVHCEHAVNNLCSFLNKK